MVLSISRGGLTGFPTDVVKRGRIYHFERLSRAPFFIFLLFFSSLLNKPLSVVRWVFPALNHYKLYSKFSVKYLSSLSIRSAESTLCRK